MNEYVHSFFKPHSAQKTAENNQKITRDSQQHLRQVSVVSMWQQQQTQQRQQQVIISCRLLHYFPSVWNDPLYHISWLSVVLIYGLILTTTTTWGRRAAQAFLVVAERRSKISTTRAVTKKRVALSWQRQPSSRKRKAVERQEKSSSNGCFVPLPNSTRKRYHKHLPKIQARPRPAAPSPNR